MELYTFPFSDVARYYWIRLPNKWCFWFRFTVRL